MHQYPKLHYPEIYILQGGYSGFFRSNKERCEPQNYVAMQDERHKSACAREMRNFSKPTSKMTRTQSFTYAPRQEEDDTMNTEDDTFEKIESRVGGNRRVPNVSGRAMFSTRRTVSY
jgi:hypothetical protein